MRSCMAWRTCPALSAAGAPSIAAQQVALHHPCAPPLALPLSHSCQLSQPLPLPTPTLHPPSPAQAFTTTTGPPGFEVFCLLQGVRIEDVSLRAVGCHGCPATTHGSGRHAACVPEHFHAAQAPALLPKNGHHQRRNGAMYARQVGDGNSAPLPGPGRCTCAAGPTAGC